VPGGTRAAHTTRGVKEACSLETVHTTKSSLGLSAFEAIKQDILYAELRPGEQLRVRLLTERHGCGASPIREALNSLVTAGLVERFDKRGFFVAGTSPKEFQDILTNRCFLEEEALRRSIAAGDSDWEERVLVAHHRMTRVPRSLGSANVSINRDWEDAHKRFHMSLISACDSPILLAHCGKLYELNIRYRFLSRTQARGSRNVSVEHDRLKELVLERQAEEAIAALKDHYMKTGSFLIEQP
jgi:DNA-binding GntR family transcriptional regulator